MMSTGGRLWNATGKLSLSITPRVKVVAIGVAVGIALLGFWARYFRRKDRKSEESDPVPEVNERGETPAPSTVSAAPGVHRWLSVHARHRNSPSIGYVTGGQAQTTEGMIYYGMESLTEAIKNWERAAMNAADSKTSRPMSEQELFDSLDCILSKARDLQSQLTELIQKYSLDIPDNISIASTTHGMVGTGSIDQIAGPSGAMRRGTLSVLSDDSFVSALEELIFEDLDILLREPLSLDPSLLLLYHQGLREVKEGNVQCRAIRTDFVGCESDDEFLAKLWSIRNAFTFIFESREKRGFMSDAGKTLIADLLKHAKRDPEPFYQAYDNMISFLENEHVWSEVEAELRHRRVAQFNFYDIVLDFILMDAFDDLASPPSAVLAVARNRLLFDSVKESTLNTLVWSVLKAKRARLLVADGFVNHFYDISERVSPVLAWGFLGTNEHLRELCYYFKDQICSFMSDIFSFQRVRYTSLTDLAEDIWLIGRTRLEILQQRLSSEVLPAES